jgi:hypothetical protein
MEKLIYLSIIRYCWPAYLPQPNIEIWQFSLNSFAESNILKKARKKPHFFHIFILKFTKKLVKIQPKKKKAQCSLFTQHFPLSLS